jgi:hypothetical protein
VSEQKYFVGQRVWLYDSNASRYNPSPIDVEVTKVGRTLVTVNYHGRPIQFRIADGSWNDRNFGHQRRIRTDEEKVLAERRADAEAVLFKLGVQFKFGAPTYSTEQLEAVVAVLRP